MVDANAAREPVWSTQDLLGLARGGDEPAIEALFDRFWPALRRWASGRLPASARGAIETQDLVQDAVIGALRHLETFEARHEGGFQGYLRQAVLNRITDVLRRQARRPAQINLEDVHPSGDASPLDVAIGHEGIARYEKALARLRPLDREAVIGRFELQFDYRQLADILGKSDANSARVAVRRALDRLLDLMEDEQ
jgi:RNA polymerase sigma-70 factor, ECF subfamily